MEADGAQALLDGAAFRARMPDVGDVAREQSQASRQSASWSLVTAPRARPDLPSIRPASSDRIAPVGRGRSPSGAGRAGEGQGGRRPGRWRRRRRGGGRRGSRRPRAGSLPTRGVWNARELARSGSAVFHGLGMCWGITWCTNPGPLRAVAGWPRIRPAAVMRGHHLAVRGVGTTPAPPLFRAGTLYGVSRVGEGVGCNGPKRST